MYDRQLRTNLRKLGHAACAHVRIGYASLLLVVDGLLCLVAVADCIRYSYTGRSLLALVRHVDATFIRDNIAFASMSLFVLLVIGPFALAVLRLFLGVALSRATRLVHRSGWITLAHILLSALLCYTLLAEHWMKVLGGFDIDVTTGECQYAFSPLLFKSWHALGAIASVVATALLKLSGAVGGDEIRGNGRSWFNNYITQVHLTDVRGDLYPHIGHHGLNFNSGAMAVETRAVRRKARRILNAYQKTLPGSPDSKKYLEALAARTRGLINELLLANLNSKDEVHIEFFSGTSRALEVALAREAARAHIIMSPYEHRSEHHVARWLASSRNCRFHVSRAVATCEAKGVSEEVEAFRNEMASLIKDTVVEAEESGTTKEARTAASDRRRRKRNERKSSRKAILVVSDVCYATGVVVPVSELRQAIKDSGAEPVLVIDGAHAVGNLRVVSSGVDWQYYVFSAHKWLLSPEPCGILISKRTPSAIPYDSWGEDLPESTANARMLASVCSGLEIIKKHGFHVLWERGRLLRNELLHRLGRRFELLGYDSNGKCKSLMVALAPARGESWRGHSIKDLEVYFDKHRASVGVFSCDRGIYVRLSFPYFLDFSDIGRMASILKGALVDPDVD